MKNVRSKILALSLSGLMLASCDMNDKYYSDVTPDTFITSEANVKALVGRTYAQWSYYFLWQHWQYSETCTDEFTCPVRLRSGIDTWYDSGKWIRLNDHNWLPDDGWLEDLYQNTMNVITRCMQVQDDLSKVSPSQCGMTREDLDDYINQMRGFGAYMYLQAFDMWGGLPLYESTQDGIKPRSTAKETFKFIEDHLLESLKYLKPKKSLGATEEGYFSLGGAAMALGELYLNAEAYIGEDRYDDAAKMFQGLIDGKYGPYAIDPKWNGPFGWEGQNSPETILYCPSLNGSGVECDWHFRRFYPRNALYAVGYNDLLYWCINGHCLTPSRRQDGLLYRDTNPEIKLGSPYESYDDGDMRKQNYHYISDGEYDGMFMVGEQDGMKPYDGYWKGGKVEGHENCILLDQIYDHEQCWKDNGDPMDYPSDIQHSNECSGVRLVKVPFPTEESLTWNVGLNVIRLPEAYFGLAECKFVRGDKQGAAELINKVRARNFEGADPNPVTASNLDKYRLAKEYMIEFLGEARRRTDLIRWGMFVTEKWWSHEPSNETFRNRFPLPDNALGGNQLLKQNPGYGSDNELSPDEI